MGAKLAFFVKNKRVKKWQLTGNWQFFLPNNGSMRSVPSTLPAHCPRRMPGHWAAKTCTSPWTSLAKNTKRLPTPGRNTSGTGISIILWGSSTKCPKKAWALPNANSSLAPLRPVISQMSDPRLQPVWGRGDHKPRPDIMEMWSTKGSSMVNDPRTLVARYPTSTAWTSVTVPRIVSLYAQPPTNQWPIWEHIMWYKQYIQIVLWWHI